MPLLLFKTMLVLTICALSTGAGAQPTYRCGSSYSQTPCPGGVVIDTADQRSNAQKAQADQATRRDMRNADALEKDRLQQETRDLANNTPNATTAVPTSNKASAPDKKQLKKKTRKTPEFFTAHGPADKNKKPVTNKPVAKDDQSKP